jgi:hypothetical protein
MTRRLRCGLDRGMQLALIRASSRVRSFNRTTQPQDSLGGSLEIADDSDTSRTQSDSDKDLSAKGPGLLRHQIPTDYQDVDKEDRHQRSLQRRAEAWTSKRSYAFASVAGHNPKRRPSAESPLSGRCDLNGNSALAGRSSCACHLGYFSVLCLR